MSDHDVQECANKKRFSMWYRRPVCEAKYGHPKEVKTSNFEETKVAFQVKFNEASPQAKNLDQ